MTQGRKKKNTIASTVLWVHYGRSCDGNVRMNILYEYSVYIDMVTRCV